MAGLQGRRTLGSNTAIVVGLHAEARLARRFGVPVVIGGGTAAGAEAAARRAVAAGATALVSFGLAGGLEPGLLPGTLVVPAAVLSDGAWFAADPALMELLGSATPHRVLAIETVVADADSKRRLLHETGAAAVDLESGAVARVAAVHGLPFAVLRAICDPAERDLPPAALVALDARGGIGLARVVASVIARPGQVPVLLRLAADAAAARRSLAGRVAAIRR
jgi:adenosylhomocysteine nucleosidase